MFIHVAFNHQKVVGLRLVSPTMHVVSLDKKLKRAVDHGFSMVLRG